MPDFIDTWCIPIGFFLFLFICGTIQSRLRKRRMFSGKVKVRKPSKKDEQAIEKLELIRPEGENWLYLRFSRKRRSLRLERWNDDALYLCLNGDIIGEFVVNREGFTGSLGERSFCFFNNTLYEDAIEVGKASNRHNIFYCEEIEYSTFSDGSFLTYLHIFKKNGSEEESELTAEKVTIGEKVVRKHYSTVYHLKQTTTFEPIIVLTYLQYRDSLYPVGD